MGGAMLRNSLLQFSVNGWGWVPSLLFDLRPNYGGGNEDSGDLLRRACTCCTHCPDPALSHGQPTPQLETPGHSWASLGQSLVGSLLLSPGSWCVRSFVCALQESVSPVLCKFWWLYVGLNADLLQEGLSHIRSAGPRAPALVAGHFWPVPSQETLRHSSGSVSVGSLGAYKVCLSPLNVSGT